MRLKVQNQLSILNEGPSLRVAAKTRDRVFAAARELRYQPKHAARALR